MYPLVFVRQNGDSVPTVLHRCHVSLLGSRDRWPVQHGICSSLELAVY